MAWRVRGRNYGSCNCIGICPCTVDLAPSGPEGDCRGMDFYSIDEGDLDGLDLAGVRLAMPFWLPGRPTEGGGRFALVVDEGATDQQARAAEAIWSGEAGGSLAEYTKLMFPDYVGLRRAPVTLSEGKRPRVAIGEQSFEFEAFTDARGTPTTLENSRFGGSSIVVGTTYGSLVALDLSFEASVGLASDFDMSSDS